jgi:hypothetical protein
MRIQVLRLVGAALLGSACSAHAAMIDFQTTPLTVGPSSLAFSAGGIGATVKGYHVEFAPGTGASTVYGPVSTAEVTEVVSASFDYYGFGRVTAAGTGTPLTGLGLLSKAPLGQTDPDLCCATFAPGFDNSTLGTVNLDTIQFALFAFDAAVDLSAVVVNRNGNADRSIWVAGGNVAPDFSAGFGSALAMFQVENSKDLSSGGLLTHAVSLQNIRYLLIGTPPANAVPGLAALDPVYGVEYYLQGIDVAPSVVPLPAGLPLLLSGLASLGVLGRRKLRAS